MSALCSSGEIMFFQFLLTVVGASPSAEVLNISKATADRYWAYPRAWLFNEISKSSYEKKIYDYQFS
jgi:hypothetical protein